MPAVGDGLAFETSREITRCANERVDGLADGKKAERTVAIKDGPQIV